MYYSVAIKINVVNGLYVTVEDIVSISDILYDLGITEKLKKSSVSHHNCVKNFKRVFLETMFFNPLTSKKLKFFAYFPASFSKGITENILIKTMIFTILTLSNSEVKLNFRALEKKYDVSKTKKPKNWRFYLKKFFFLYRKRVGIHF